MKRARARSAGWALLALLALLIGAPGPARAGDASSDIMDLVPKLLPAVVNISTRQFVQTDPDKNHVAAENAQTKQSLGSGFIIDPSGIIVTNNHVIANGYQIDVTLQDNLTLRASVIATSEVADIAVLKVNAMKPLPTVQFGDSDKVRVGQHVLAIGNPLGLGGSVSSGIISALNRDIMLSPYDDFMQTDAAINHGNSGGPLFNMRGQVIAMNTAIYSNVPQGGSIGLGFAVPANDVKFVVNELRSFGRVRAGYLGAHIEQVTDDIAQAIGLPLPGGAIIDDVVPGGPADLAHLQQGDVILKAGGRDTPDTRAVSRAIGETPIGHLITLIVFRDGAERAIDVTVDDWPGQTEAVHAMKASTAQDVQTHPADLGLGLGAMSDGLRARYGIAADVQGVVITQVAPHSVSDDRGVAVGDVVLKVQMNGVATPDELRHDIDLARQQARPFVLMLMQRQGNLHWVALPLG